MGGDSQANLEVWGPYPDYDDIAKLEYGRLLWRSEAARAGLLDHWCHDAHPHRERFLANRPLIEEALATRQSDTEFDASLRRRGHSLRTVARMLPGMFGKL